MRKSRLAVASFFLVNGLVYGNWTARLPEIQSFFGISNQILGSVLLVLAIGALVSMPFTGWLNLRYSGHKITLITGVGVCIMTPFLVSSSHLYFIVPVFFLFGLCNGAMDVAMNGQAVYVERAYQRPIISSFHAMFSIGMALGAGMSALITKTGLSLQTHFIFLSGLSLVLILFASGNLIKEEPDPHQSGNEPGFRWPTKAILPLGLIAFCGMTGEGSMADWSAIFITIILKSSEFYGALAIGIFSAAMTVGRIFGDYFTALLGKRLLLLTDTLLAIAGLSLLLFSGHLITALVGLGIMGLGLSTVVPIVYAMAGNTPGVKPSVGIAMATTIGYTGFFVGPPVIGFLSDSFNLKVGLGFSLFLFLSMFVIILYAFRPVKE